MGPLRGFLHTYGFTREVETREGRWKEDAVKRREKGTGRGREKGAGRGAREIRLSSCSPRHISFGPVGSSLLRIKVEKNDWFTSQSVS